MRTTEKKVKKVKKKKNKKMHSLSSIIKLIDVKIFILTQKNKNIFYNKGILIFNLILLF